MAEKSGMVITLFDVPYASSFRRPLCLNAFRRSLHTGGKIEEVTTDPKCFIPEVASIRKGCAKTRLNDLQFPRLPSSRKTEMYQTMLNEVIRLTRRRVC